jgi:hypothetical protein
VQLSPTDKFRYCDEIMSYYESRRGSFLVISSADWHVLYGWLDRGIPLRVVLTAMKLCKDPASGPPKSLSYFSGAVEDEVARVQKALA